MTEDSTGALRHSKVYFLADMLCIDDLKTLAAEKFQGHLKNHWVLADFHEIVKDIYTNTASSDKALRDGLLDAAIEHHGELKADGPYKSVLLEYGEFSGALVLRDSISKGTTKRCCPNCNRTGGSVQYYCSSYCGGYYPLTNL